jgi:hypothetical protein
MTDDTAAKLQLSVERLEKAVNRFCVVAERILSQHQHNETQAGKALAQLHPNMKRIQAEVAAKHQRMRR